MKWNLYYSISCGPFFDHELNLTRTMDQDQDPSLTTEFSERIQIFHNDQLFLRSLITRYIDLNVIQIMKINCTFEQCTALAQITRPKVYRLRYPNALTYYNLFFLSHLKLNLLSLTACRAVHGAYHFHILMPFYTILILCHFHTQAPFPYPDTISIP